MRGIMYSMTGFGRAEAAEGDWQVTVEIKSLNGKLLDLNLKLPPLLKSMEFAIRNLLSNRLVRGNIDCTITIKLNGATKPVVLNTDLIRSYYKTLETLSAELNLDMSNVLEALLKLPEVVMPVTEDIDATGRKIVEDTLQTAMDLVMEHRKLEGAVMAGDIRERITLIDGYARDITALAAKRPDYMRDNLRKKIEEALGKENFDRNRLEQEIIYYIEKYDISEELTRLKNHCSYFYSLLDSEEDAKGKKLGFLLQEIGREINTTGAKAYDAEMQKLVVAMKDELEKAKEQMMNVL